MINLFLGGLESKIHMINEVEKEVIISGLSQLSKDDLLKIQNACRLKDKKLLIGSQLIGCNLYDLEDSRY